MIDPLCQMTEKRPLRSGWTEVGNPTMIARLAPTAGMILAIRAWQLGVIKVISGLEDAELPDGAGVGPQWHLSVSCHPRRARGHEVRVALRDFDMVGAEEDNHHPGVARHFWRPLEVAHRVECQCKADEAVIVDPRDGYAWTNPKTGACRGCEGERLGMGLCPLHKGVGVGR